MSEILFPVLCLGGLGLLFGVVLGYASKKFAVEVDPLVPLVRECLPGANCGGCGFAGCDAFAEAVASGAAPANGCPIGGADCAEKVATVMGVEVSAEEPKVAFVRCKGSKSKAIDKAAYYGVEDCSQAMVVPGGGNKACEYGCLGFGSCVKACQFDAIDVIDGVAVVNEDNCVACGACVTACPKNLIDLIPKKQLVRVACTSQNKGAEVKKACEVGCIGCTLCVKACPFDSIEMNGNLPVINDETCKNCGLCEKKCPTGAIINLRKPKAKKAAPAKKAETAESTEKTEA